MAALLSSPQHKALFTVIILHQEVLGLCFVINVLGSRAPTTLTPVTNASWFTVVTASDTGKIPTG